MGTTADNWTVGGNLAVTGTSTHTGASTFGAITSTGAASFGSTLYASGAATLAGTLSVAGAATLSSTLAVTGESTLTGQTRVDSQFGVGSVAVLRDMNKSSLTYTWLYADGTNGPTMARLRLYDYGTNAFRTAYLYNGTLIAS